MLVIMPCRGTGYSCVPPGELAMVYRVIGIGFGLVPLLKNQYNAKLICVTRSQAARETVIEINADATVIDGTDSAIVTASALRSVRRAWSRRDC